MPYIQNGDTGKKLIEEVNSALDKRGNPDGSGIQNIDGDIKLKGILEVSGDIFSKGKILSDFIKKDILYSDIATNPLTIENKENNYKLIIFAGKKENDFKLYMINPNSLASLQKLDNAQFYFLGTIRGQHSGMSMLTINLGLEYDLAQDKWVNRFNNNAPIAIGQGIGKQSNVADSLGYHYVITDITEDYIEIKDSREIASVGAVIQYWQANDSDLVLSYSLILKNDDSNYCIYSNNYESSTSYSPKIDLSYHYDREVSEYILDYIRVYHTEMVNSIKNHIYGSIYYN